VKVFGILMPSIRSKYEKDSRVSEKAEPGGSCSVAAFAYTGCVLEYSLATVSAPYLNQDITGTLDSLVLVTGSPLRPAIFVVHIDCSRTGISYQGLPIRKCSS
jgi:hypothetical protein